jgi:AraC-like DNA-binding protein/quercetin dioxygenase-like cupin family protein
MCDKTLWAVGSKGASSNKSMSFRHVVVFRRDIMKQPYYKLNDEIVIQSIHSFHYTELARDYVYEGEKHDFWEFMYVDRGELEINTDVNLYNIKQGEMVFYSPNEFHALKCSHGVPSNIFIISFGCLSEAMRVLSHKLLRVGNDERKIMNMLIEEGRKACLVPAEKARKVYKFNPKTSARTADSKASEAPQFGSQQLIKVYLVALIIQIIRGVEIGQGYQKLSTVTKERQDNILAANVAKYLEERVTEPLRIEQICNHFSVSKSLVSHVFREYSGISMMEYYYKKKIERAKLLIREETYNITQISELLGYNSVHYFSRQFKKEIGMTPTEYLKTLEARM